MTWACDIHGGLPEDGPCATCDDLRIRLSMEFPWLLTDPGARRLTDIALALTGHAESFDYDVLAEACRLVARALGLRAVPVVLQ